MKFGDTIKIVTRNLRRRKGRTILTAIGVTIGTAAIVAMMSLAIGLKDNVVRSLNQFGSLTEIQVYPVWNRDNPRSVMQLDDSAVDKIKVLTGVSAVMPRGRVNGQVKLETDRKTGYIEVFGVDAKVAPQFDYKMAEGRYLTGGRNEAVISNNVPESLSEKQSHSRRNKNGQAQNSTPVFADADAKELDIFKPQLVNKLITLTLSKGTSDGTQQTKEFRFKVVGMLTKAQNGWGGGYLHLPLETVEEMNKWFGDNSNGGIQFGQNEEVYDTLMVKVPNRMQVENVVNQIKALGYMANSPITELQEVNKVFLIVQIILGGIGAISLLVATIGIINTMVMSILERTREIGIMKVLGATIPNIRNLFLIEAGTIGFAGGVIGLLVSYSIAGIILMVKPGDTVKPGDLLFAMDEGDGKLLLEQEQLNHQGKLDTLNTIKDKTKSDKIVSPVSGKLSKWLVKEGDHIQEFTTVAEITDPDLLEVTAPFGPVDFERLKVGQRAKVMTEETWAYIDAVITKIDKKARPDIGGGMVQDVTVRFKNPGGVAVGKKATIEVDFNDGSSLQSFYNQGFVQTMDPVKVRAGGTGIVEKLEYREGDLINQQSILLRLNIVEEIQRLRESELAFKQSQLALEIRKKGLSKFQILADQTGIVTEVNVTIGQNPPSDKPAIVISNTEGLELRAKIEEDDIPFIHVGQPALVYASAFGDRAFPGVITEIAGLEKTMVLRCFLRQKLKLRSLGL